METPLQPIRVWFLFAFFLIAWTSLKAQSPDYWVGSSSDWFTATNWSYGQPDGSGTHAVPSSGGIAWIDSNTGEMPILLSGTTLNVDNFTVGYSTSSGANTALTINSGAALTTGTSTIGEFNGATGRVTVYGSWSPTGDLYVGQYGTGTLVIDSGGTVTGYRGFVGASGGTGSVTVSGTGSSWSQDSTYGMLGIGYGTNAHGTLTISSGGLVSNPVGVIGYSAGAVGTVTVTGTGSTWSMIGVTGYLNVGDTGGTGSLTISSGGQVSVATDTAIGTGSGANGVVTVTGTGSTLQANRGYYVGSGGTGSLTISNGGTVTVNATASYYSAIGAGSGSSGNVTVTGSGSSWTNSGNLYVGSGGNASELTISNGGVVSSAAGRIGYSTTQQSTAIVTGTGSLWTNTGNLSVGYSGNGALTLTDGGTVKLNNGDGTLYLGDGSTSSIGIVNFGAAATSPAAAAGVLNAAVLNTPTSYGTGTVQFNHTATSALPYYLTTDGTASGANILISGKTQVINTAGYTVLQGTNTYTGATTVNGGTLRVEGSIASSFLTTVASGATLTGAGSIGTLSLGGTYAPGNSPALVSVGNLTLTSTGILQMEIGGLVRGTDYDALDINGALAADGTLNVTFINSFTPTGAASFNLFDFTSATGTFATVNLPTLGAGYSWDTSALYTAGELSISASAIPEPSISVLLAGVGALGLAILWRSSRKTRICQNPDISGTSASPVPSGIFPTLTRS